MKSYATDYETYTQIKWDLHRPIQDNEIDFDTLKRLYESKLAYLERLRISCFTAINQKQGSTFQMKDYEYILLALKSNKERFQELFRTSPTLSLCHTFLIR